jgi:putative membrane protein
MAKTTYLSEADHLRVSQAVAAAEAHTAGEIVTIVADRSDDYNDIALAWATVVAFLAIAVFTAFPDFYLGLIDRLLGRWSYDWTQREVLSVALGIGVIKFIGMVLIQLWQPLKFFLIPGQVRTSRALLRAVGFFKVGAERRTHGRTGILIYLSMREHRAEILADQAIAEKVEAEVWGHAMASMLVEIKQGRVADGMIAAVDEVGKVLAEHFPRAQDDQNELPDRLIEI